MSIRLNIPLAKAPFNPLQYISLALSSAATLNEPFFVASYADFSGNNLVSEITNTGTATDTTPVTLIPTAGVGISRKLTFLSINNPDITATTVIISMNTVTGTGTEEVTKTVTIYQCTLQPNYTLVFDENDNFKVFDQNGVLQEGNTGAIGSFYQTAESLGVPLTQRPTFNAFSGLLMVDNPSWMRTDIYLADSGVNPGIYGGTGYIPVLTINGQGQITSATQVAIGGGTVTNFSAGNLSPLFTTSVANPTTSPALTFNLNSQSQNLFFASPNGSSGVPSFRAIAAGDINGIAVGGDLAGTLVNPTIKSSVNLSGSPTTTTQSAGDNSTKVATTAYLDQSFNSSAWVDFSGTANLTGCSGSPTINVARYCKNGKSCTIDFSASFASNNASKTITLPFASKSSIYKVVAYNYDAHAGAVLLSQMSLIASSTTLTIYYGLGGGAWSTNGTAGSFIYLTIIYETT